jgi:EamA domain-containing membrane protein RarD
MTGVGALDMAGNASFVLAVQAGSLAVAARLIALSGDNVVLEMIFLRERVTQTDAVGIGVAVAAITCIAIGSS